MDSKTVWQENDPGSRNRLFPFGAALLSWMPLMGRMTLTLMTCLFSPSGVLTVTLQLPGLTAWS